MFMELRVEPIAVVERSVVSHHSMADTIFVLWNDL